MHIHIHIVSILLVGASISPALAFDKLPSKAVPIPAAELKAAYSGKTIKWPDASMYWAPDGTVIGVHEKAVGDGTWSVSDGKVCNDMTWLGEKPTDKPWPLKNCFRFMRDGKTIYHQFTSDKMKRDTGWWRGKSDIPRLKEGNLIQDQYDANKALKQKS